MGDELEDERKAVADPEKFLRERFQNAPPTDVAILKSLENHERKALHIAVDDSPLGLGSTSVDAPREGEGSFVGSTASGDRWLLIGRDRSSIQEKIQQVSRESSRARQRVMEAHDETMRRKMNVSTTNDREWDVGGLWDIKFCQSKVVGWANRDGKRWLDIRFVERTGEGVQMWARFHFKAMKGVFRFLKPDRNEELNDFYLAVDEKPSPGRPKWNYRWRGEETYDGTVFKSEERLGSITFGGVDGRVLTGVFDSDWTEKIEFKGLKTGPSPCAPSSEWEIIDREWRRREQSSEVSALKES